MDIFAEAIILLIFINFGRIDCLFSKSVVNVELEGDEILCESDAEKGFGACLAVEKNVKLKLGDSRNGPDLIRGNGFPLEIHPVTSSDGYVTNLYRIPWGRNQSDTGGRKVVLLHHGMLEDAFSWILNSVDKALAYRLADEADVDVWMTNNRGTYYSLGHSHLSYANHRYWNYSFHEIGIYDVPAVIDYILQVSGQRDLYYIGHSMGCSAFMVAMSECPEYNDKIRAFIGLAPAIIVGKTSAPFVPWIPFVLKQQEVHDLLQMSTFVSPAMMPIMSVVGKMCSNRIAASWICFAVLEAIFGYEFEETNNYDLAGEISRNALSSASMKSLFHLLHLWRSGRFHRYDYLSNNDKAYGSSSPPDYDLSKVTCSIVVFCGDDDDLVSCDDVKEVTTKLSNVKEFGIIKDKFNHIDFMFSKNINALLNDRIVQIIKMDEFYNK